MGLLWITCHVKIPMRRNQNKNAFVAVENTFRDVLMKRIKDSNQLIQDS